MSLIETLLAPYSFPLFFIILIMIFITILLIYIIWSTYKFLIPMFRDMIIFFDNNMRWSLVYAKLKGIETYTKNDKIYHLNESASLLNNKGKVLYMFTENEPTPLKIERNETKWLNGASLKGIIDNNIIKQIVKPTDKFMDMLLLFGAIGGILSALSSIVVLLIVTGVLKPTP